MKNTYLVRICSLGDYVITLRELVTADNEAEAIALFKASLPVGVYSSDGYYSNGEYNYETLAVTLIESDKAEYIRQLFNV